MCVRAYIYIFLDNSEEECLFLLTLEKDNGQPVYKYFKIFHGGIFVFEKQQ